MREQLTSGHAELVLRERMAARIDQLVGSSFEGYIERAFPGFRWYRYNREVVGVLQALADGDLELDDGSQANRVFVHLRSQTGKSTLIALFCAYLMVRFPGVCIGVSMLRQDQTETFSRNVQTFYRQAGGTLHSSAVHNWETSGRASSDRSKMWALSKGASPVGKPADVLIGDDLMGGAADAAHRGQFQKDKGWFRRGFLSRKRTHRHAGLGRHLEILINTRQGLSDIASYWLYLGSWYCVILPTLYQPDEWPISVPVGPFPAGDGDTTLPDTTVEAPNCRIHPDWRQPGEALEPSVEDLSAKAFHARRAINPGGFQSEEDVAANEQGCPRPAFGGGICHRAWLPFENPRPKDILRTIRAWDTATSEGSGDWTASVLMAELTNGRFAILHGCRAKKDSVGVAQLITAMSILDGRETTVAMPVGMGEGKLTYQGLEDKVRALLLENGCSVPPFRAMPVRRQSRDDQYRSAKHERFSRPGGFADAAQPPDWNWNTKAFSVSGSVEVWKEYDVWGRGYSGMNVANEIVRLGMAATSRGPNPVPLAQSLNVCPGPWAQVLVDEAHNFSGFDGGSDNYVDALSDAKIGLASGISGPWTG